MAPETVTKKPPSLSTQVSGAVVWNALFVPLRMGAEVLANLVKLNVLTAASFGILALISNTNSLLGTWIDLGTARALPKYIPETSRAGGPRAVLRLLTAVLVAQAALLALVTVGLVAYAPRMIGQWQAQVRAATDLSGPVKESALYFLGSYGVGIVAAIVALLFLGVCYDMAMAYLNSFFKQRAWNSVDLAAKLLPPLLSAGAILAGLDIVGVLAAMVLAPTIAVALASWQVLRLWRATSDEQRVASDERRATSAEQRVTSDERRATSDERRATRGASAFETRNSSLETRRSPLPAGFVRYCAVLFLMTMTDFMASARFAVFFAGNIADVALLWAGASVVQMALGYLYTPMVGVQVPLFTRVRAGEGGTLNGAYQSLARLQVLLLIPGGVGLVLLAQPALLVLTPKYLDAAALVWVLVPCLFLECLLTTAYNALSVYEHLGVLVASRVIAVAFVVSLALLLSPVLGVVGVALAFGLARVAAGLWVTAGGYRRLGLRWPWRFTLRVLLASAAMALLVLGVRGLLPAPPAAATIADRLIEGLLLLATAAAGAAAFLGALRLTGGLDPRDREQLTKMRLPGKRWILRLL